MLLNCSFGLVQFGWHGSDIYLLYLFMFTLFIYVVDFICNVSLNLCLLLYSVCSNLFCVLISYIQCVFVQHQRTQCAPRSMHSCASHCPRTQVKNVLRCLQDVWVELVTIFSVRLESRLCEIADDINDCFTIEVFIFILCCTWTNSHIQNQLTYN